MRILLKVGGAQLERNAERLGLARAIRGACDAGHEVIVVHGGGNQLRELCSALGIDSRYRDGLRLTDAATADAALCILGGKVNRLLVHSLQTAGVRAVGICGADGGTFSARKHAPDGHDLGFVGAVERVDRALVDTLLANGFVPVIGTVAPLAAGEPGDDAHFYNINADQAAAPLAGAFDCGAMLFLTDVAGVLDGDGEVLLALGESDCERLRGAGVISGGMIPKVAAALAAAARNPDAITKIAPADRDDAVLAALRPDAGTRFVAEVGHG